MVLSPAGFVMMVMMAVAGRTLGKGDPRLMVMLGYIATAIGLFNLTRLDLYTSFGTATLWRMLQVIGLPFIFIPISTLNYVGVPRNKMNQISSLSNFARNIGGSAGTALLTTYLARSAQVHQLNLASHLSAGSIAVRQADRAVCELDSQLDRSGAVPCSCADLWTDAKTSDDARVQECIRNSGRNGCTSFAAGVDHAAAAQEREGRSGADGSALAVSSAILATTAIDRAS